MARFPHGPPAASLAASEIVAEDRNVGLVPEGYGVAIRARPKPEEDLVGRCIAKDPLLIFASPTLARPEIDDASGAARVPAVVRAIGEDPGRWTVQDGDRRLLLDPDSMLRLSTLAIREAARAGAGAALSSHHFVRDDIAEGRLVSWGELVGEPFEFWVLHASARLASRKVRDFVTMVVEAFGEYPRRVRN